MKNHPFSLAFGAAALLCALTPRAVFAQQTNVIVPSANEKWAATWATSPVGAFTGNAYTNVAIPAPTTDGANNQTMRMIIKPDLWGKSMRFRFSNTFGSRPVTFGEATVALQTYGANVQPGTTTQLFFNGGSPTVTIPVGQEIYSDPVTLNFVAGPDDPTVLGRKLAVSFYVPGTSGPITYHQLGVTSSFLTGSGTGNHTTEENDASYPYTSGGPFGPWFFIDAADVVAPANTSVVCAFGDSITDHVFMTFNGDDSWPDNLSRRLHATYGNYVSVVNEAISGNRVLPTTATANNNQGATVRLDRDVLGLAGLTHVVWLEGINDLGGGTQSDPVIQGYQNVVGRLHAKNIKVAGATVLSSLSPTGTGYGSAAVNAQRQNVNGYIRTSGLFDSIADMDAATVDPVTGYLQAPYAQHSFSNPTPEYLHPGRAGFQVMAFTVDLKFLAPAGE